MMKAGLFFLRPTAMTSPVSFFFPSSSSTDLLTIVIFTTTKRKAGDSPLRIHGRWYFHCIPFCLVFFVWFSLYRSKTTTDDKKRPCLLPIASFDDQPTTHIFQQRPTTAHQEQQQQQPQQPKSRCRPNKTILSSSLRRCTTGASTILCTTSRVPPLVVSVVPSLTVH